MSYQVDVWSGDLHQNHFDCRSFDAWEDASSFMLECIQTGMLCNVLHTDFKAPPHRVEEMDAELAKLVGNKGDQS